MLDRDNEMRKLRQQGMSYREIAEQFGVSFQRVYQILGSQNISYFKPVTEKQCVYKGVRDWMNNTKTSFAELLRKIYGKYHTQTACRVRQYLNGKNEISMSYINAILEVTGLTYEEAFRID